MIVLIGAVLAAGLLLILSPWLWPPGDRPIAVRGSGRARRLLDVAGYAHIPAGRLAMFSMAAAVGSASAAWLATGLLAVALTAAAAGAHSPTVWLRSRARRLRRARRTLWPDVCDLLVASVRSGMSLPDGVASLAESAPPALRPAFRVFSADLAASGHFDSALLRLKAVLGDPVSDRILETLRMARQVGGTELTAVLRALSASVRTDAALRGEIEARQSWTRGAAVLGVVAPWLVLGLLAARPEGSRAYASPEGFILILAGAGVSVVAYRLMVRLGRLPEPQRWFG